MWIFTDRGFLSIVADEADPDMLIVRSRFKGDIQAIFRAAQVEQTPDADYLYRTRISRTVVSQTIARKLRRIDYTNFKNACPAKREPLYLRIWMWMKQAQDGSAIGSFGNLAPSETAIRSLPMTEEDCERWSLRLRAALDEGARRGRG
jgi:hypothetical protein